MARTTRSVGRPPAQPLARPVHALKQRLPRVLEAGGLEVGVEDLGRPVVGRHVMSLSALLVEPKAPSAPLLEASPRGELLSRSPGGLEPGRGAFADQLPLELGQRREDAEHESAGRGGGVDLRALAGEHPQAHAPG